MEILSAGKILIFFWDVPKVNFLRKYNFLWFQNFLDRLSCSNQQNHGFESKNTPKYVKTTTCRPGSRSKNFETIKNRVSA